MCTLVRVVRGPCVVCWAISNTTLLASLNAHDSSAPFASVVPPLSPQAPSSPEDEGLPQCSGGFRGGKGGANAPPFGG